MIRCIPLGICSWDFRLEGEGHKGQLKFAMTGEQGAVIVDAVRFDVRKHGVFSGRWTLCYRGDEVVQAQKSSPFTRAFQLETPDGLIQLTPLSPLGRSFRVCRGEEVLATISPDHPATRRACIEIQTDRWDAPVLFFRVLVDRVDVAPRHSEQLTRVQY